MTASSLIIIADRGGLKAYRVRETPTRGPSLKLVQAFDIPNVNELSRTDHTTAVTDWPQLEREESRRICKQLAEEITRIVRLRAGEGWSLAAPESITQKFSIFYLPKSGSGSSSMSSPISSKRRSQNWRTIFARYNQSDPSPKKFWMSI